VAPALVGEVLKACVRVAARYAGVPAAEVSITVEEVREGVLFDSARGSGKPTTLWVSLAVEPDGSRFFVEMEAAFCASLVDRAVAGEGVAPLSRRPLTEIEKAVLEFIWLMLVREVNAQLGKPLFRLEALRAEPPEWLGAQTPAGLSAPADARDSASHGLVVSVSVTASETVGLVRCGLARGAVEALGSARNPLLARGPRAANAEKLARLRHVVPDVALCLLIGETEVEAGELASLENDDVLVVERSFVGWSARSFFGRARLRAGAGPGPVIVGKLVRADTSEAAPGDEGDALAGAALGLMVTEALGGEAPSAAERLKMEDEISSEPTAEGAAVLDALMLTVHVELAARRLSLEDLARLRLGQVLELDCKATDPVDLVAEGRRIARGELVDIEGRLGVRVTHVVG
jgi:type III secretion protein Q